jgi:ribonuclease Z
LYPATVAASSGPDRARHSQEDDLRTVFLPSLLNGLSGDPGLWVDLLDEGRSVLLDLGELSHLPSRKLLRVERVLVTHTHVDHFIGFDHLLRLALGRDRPLTVTGPPGFLQQVRGKISAYTWNLIHEYPVQLVAEEVDGEVVRAERYTGPGRMEPEPLPDRPFSGVLHAERLFTFHAAMLDHGIPVLGAALRETEHLSVDADRLRKLGLAPGAWLRDLKHSVRRKEPDEDEVRVDLPEGAARMFRRGELAAEILRRGPGQRIAYLTDLACTPENLERGAELARDADLLVCEAAFLHEDAALARERMHLTARQAGELARAAGAKRLAPFHLSPRYQGREGEILAEAAEAFGGPVLTLGAAAR